MCSLASKLGDRAYASFTSRSVYTRPGKLLWQRALRKVRVLLKWRRIAGGAHKHEWLHRSFRLHLARFSLRLSLAIHVCISLSCVPRYPITLRCWCSPWPGF